MIIDIGTKKFWRKVFILLAKIYLISFSISIFIFLMQGIYTLGYSIGFREGQGNSQSYYEGFFEELAKLRQGEISPTQVPSQTITITQAPRNNLSLIRDVSWGGPDLWEAVNTRRIELGVNTLATAEDLCTIASIRLNELLELGKLDGHEGFSNMKERRPDLAYIFEKYSTIAEFLAAGAGSAEETVSLWENTLGHKKLMTGGEFVWGCIYAQNSFAVAIAAY